MQSCNTVAQEIEAIPMPEGDQQSQPSVGNSSDNTWELQALQEMKSKQLPVEKELSAPEKFEEILKQNEISKPSKSSAYSMFVKGESEFVNTGSPKMEPVTSERADTSESVGVNVESEDTVQQEDENIPDGE